MFIRPLFFFFVPLLAEVTSMSLDELVCRRRPETCLHPKESSSSSQSHFLSDQPRHRPSNFRSWRDYGSGWNDGTGMGIGAGPNYGQGLGEVDIMTGVGVRHPFGAVGIERNLHVGWGGTGRIGGHPFGFGNGIGGNGYSSSVPAWLRLRPFTYADTWPMPLGYSNWAIPNWNQ